jgi:hypothetical protein
MSYKKSMFIICFLLLSGLSGIKAQESISASGGNAPGTVGSMSYTVGQVFYNTILQSDGFLVQGVQHPYEISIETGLKEITGINISISVYPNPAADNLTLAVNDIDVSDLWYQLFDFYGKLLVKKKIIGTATDIPMSSFSPSVYFLKISHNDIEVKTFKIIKK